MRIVDLDDHQHVSSAVAVEPDRAHASSLAIPPRGPAEVRCVIDSAHAPQGHLLAQPDAVAVADLPLLLQVLRVRDAPGAPVLARGGPRAARRRRAPARQGAAGADRRAARGQRRRARAAGGVRPRGLHRLRRLDLRARARAGPAAAHQPRRALARGSRAAARGDGLAGADARVDLRAADGDRPRRLADQAPGAPPARRSPPPAS